MSGNAKVTVTIELSEEELEQLRDCARWRNVTVEECAAAYVKDWIDIDYPESQGRHTRRGLYRDGPLSLNPQT